MDKLFHMLGDWKKTPYFLFLCQAYRNENILFCNVLPSPSIWSNSFLLVRPWSPGSTRVWSSTSGCSCVHMSVPDPRGQSSPVLVGYEDWLALDEMTLSSCPQCRCGWEAAEPRSWQVQTLPGQVLSLTKMMLPHTGTGGQLGNRAAEGASRRDFKDKEEPAKLTEQARTDSCVQCRHREPEMF